MVCCFVFIYFDFGCWCFVDMLLITAFGLGCVCGYFVYLFLNLLVFSLIYCDLVLLDFVELGCEFGDFVVLSFILLGLGFEV